MIRSFRLLAALVALLMVLAACGGNGGADEPDGSGSGGDTAGSSSGGGSDGDSDEGTVELSGDFPVPLADGLDRVIIEIVGSDGQSTIRQLAYPRDDFDRIVAFYDDWASSQADEWFRSESEGVVSWFLNSDGKAASVVINRDFEESGDIITFVMMSG